MTPKAGDGLLPAEDVRPCGPEYLPFHPSSQLLPSRTSRDGGRGTNLAFTEEELKELFV